MPFDPKAKSTHGFRAVGQGFPENSVGWYRRTFDLPASDSGRRLWLEFDGAFRDYTGIKRWTRRITLEANGNVRLHEAYLFDRRSGPTQLNLLTPCAVSESAPGVLELAPFPGGKRGARLLFDARLLRPTVETIPLDDARLRGSWGPELHRIQFTLLGDDLSGEYQITLALHSR